jgi:hypothetical protein
MQLYRDKNTTAFTWDYNTHIMMLLLILLLRQLYKLVSFPVTYCWKANMPSRLSYLVECFEPPLSSIFLMIDVGLSWRVRARSEVRLSWGTRMGTKQPSPRARVPTSSDEALYIKRDESKTKGCL